MRDKSRVAKNVFFGFGSKLLSLALGLIVPRLFIVSFGSEINGVISTITQIYTYLALLEAGIGNSAVNALYEPLSSKNYDVVNKVLTQARRYYRKVTAIYAIAVIIFAVMFPALVNSAVSYKTILLIILFQGIANCTTYYYVAVYDQLLMAAGKRYVTENTVFLVHIITTIVRIALIYFGFDVLVVQGVYSLLSIARVPFTIYYCRRKYRYLDFHSESNQNYLHERKAFVIHELSCTIFSNTDVVIISTFCSFALASVYSVYNLVFSALNSMINMANDGLGFLIGENVHGDREKLIKIYDMYSLLYSVVIFACMTVAMIMIVPFVNLYTKGISDIDYILPFLPELFTIVALLSGVRAVASRLITVSGHAGKTQNRSILEMVINLSASLVLVNICGLHGVLIGTVIALIYRANDIIIYANKVILNRNPWKEYRSILYLSATFLAFWLLSKKYMITCDSYISFVLYAFIVFMVVTSTYLVVTFIFDRNKMKTLFKICAPRFIRKTKI